MESKGYKLADFLKKGGKLLLDGGVGTEIQRRGVETPIPLWSASALLNNPDIVYQIHSDYISSGARVIKSNTFRTTKRVFKKSKIKDQSKELTALAVKLAQQAIDDSTTNGTVFLGGVVAPLEDCYSPELIPDENEIIEEHGEHIANLKNSGVDFIALETFNSITEAKLALQVAAELNMPTWVSFVCTDNETLLSGEKIADAVKVIEELNPFAVLLNCMPPEKITGALKELKLCTSLPVGIYGNGMGKPHNETGWAYEENISLSGAKYAMYGKEWEKIGAQLIGGCCGTTPEYIRQLRDVLSAAYSS